MSDDTGSDEGEGGVAVATAVTVCEYVVRAVVEHPDEVRVEVDDHGRRPTLNVYVASGDMGRVIGKRGRVAQSIRQVVRAAAARDETEVDVEFVD
ncbi:MAG: KH domain-containing protein [Acidimicrobiales bacterium]